MKDYPGSKCASGVWQRIISEMPPHETYIEPFLGTGVVCRQKRAATNTVVVDMDRRCIQAYLDTIGDGRGNAGVTAICGDAISFLEQRRFCSGDLVYADPPYLMETRSCQRRYYRYE